jgi:chemotaxis regulatin CheY-phosphate phosphatase CheZ
VEGGPQDAVVFNRLGHLARQLHDSLRGLGVDKLLPTPPTRFRMRASGWPTLRR